MSCSCLGQEWVIPTGLPIGDNFNPVFLFGKMLLLLLSQARFHSLTISFSRCDDTPIVYTHLKDMSNGNGEHFLSVCAAGDKFLVPFKPESLCMFPRTGRVYHEARERFGGIGLIKSSLAIELSTGFRFDDQINSTDHDGASFPTRFVWNDNEYALSNELVGKLSCSDS